MTAAAARKRRRALLQAICVLVLASLLGAGCRTAPPAGGGLDPDAILSRLTTREKAAQLVFVGAHGVPMHPDSAEYRELEWQVSELGVGGVVLFDSDLESIPPLVDRLQRAADIPLLVASDLEAGLGYRVRRGSTPLPTAMAIGATGSVEAARFAGELTAREALALGIDWIFAPVVDVNNNPGNPVIGVRSFGEDPELVARMGRAFVEGAQSVGALATAKHFPGHGDTTVDSHEALPVLAADRARLDAVELLPFRELIATDVASVMTGHLAVPALDPTGTPASLSLPMTGALLRAELGFDGLVVTDALRMEGAGGVWPGAAAVQAILAGADIVLLPEDARVAVESITRAVAEGILSEERLDRSVRRVLEAKQRVGAARVSPRNGVSRAIAIGSPDDAARARSIAEASVTLVRDRAGRVPLRADRITRLLHLVLQDTPARGSRAQVTAEAIERRVPTVTTLDVPVEISATLRHEILRAAAGAEEVVLSTTSRTGALPADQKSLIAELTEVGAPPVLLALTSPYVLGSVPRIPAYLCAYGAWAISQEATVAALFGETDLRGRLPVSLPGQHAAGTGLQQSAYPMALELAPRSLPEIDRAVEHFIAERAFPGAVIAAARTGETTELVHLRGYGRHTYDAASPAVTTGTIYDLASLTKVIATTTMAMILVDEGRIELDTPLEAILPGFRGPDKERVTLRHLLTHSSGIDWWAPLYEELEGTAAYVERIQAMDLVYLPGEKTLYSDLGLILLGEALERAAGEPFESFVQGRIFEPLGMLDTGFSPDEFLLERIAPTELDREWRKRIVHGEVHDENAFALGGVAPHAGLFSTAEDLARFAQMITNGGVYAHQRIVSRETLEEFTRIAHLVPDSTRALGWDTKSPEGSSAGTLFSPRSFGHTGFTGTSIWFDPERDLFLVILTNRVHPTRDNKLIRQARPAIADALIGSLEPRPHP